MTKKLFRTEITINGLKTI